MSVTCRDCALPYEEWPEGGCPNCRSPEPALQSVPQPSGPESPTGGVNPPGAGPEPPPDFDGETPRESPGTGTPVEPVEVPLGEEADVPPDYTAWTVAELRAECERRRLPATGLKAALVVRLETADGGYR